MHVPSHGKTDVPWPSWCATAKTASSKLQRRHQSSLVVTVGVVGLLAAARARAGDQGRGAHGEVVVMVEHTVDLGMELEKWI